MRGQKQKLFLIETVETGKKLEKEYVIMGSTGNVYKVVICNNPHCNCPDYTQRMNRCKHIYFVLIRIMNAPNVDQETYSNRELTQMFKNIPEITNFLKVTENVKKTYEMKKNKKISEKDFDDLCPICLDDLLNDEEILTCKFSCGKHVHSNCYEMCNKGKDTRLCIYCKHTIDQQGYINLNS